MALLQTDAALTQPVRGSPCDGEPISWWTTALLALMCLLVVGLVAGLQVDSLRDIGQRNDVWPWVAAIGRTRAEAMDFATRTDADAQHWLAQHFARRPINGVMTAVMKKGAMSASPFENGEYGAAAVSEANRLLLSGLPPNAQGEAQANVELNIPRRRSVDVAYQYAPDAEAWIITFCSTPSKKH